MEWWVVLSFFIGGLVFLFLMGFPIAIAFFLMDFICIFLFMGNTVISPIRTMPFPPAVA